MGRCEFAEQPVAHRLIDGERVQERVHEIGVGPTIIMTADIVDVRSALINAYYSIGFSIPSFSPIIGGTTIVQAAHFQDLRNLVK